MPALHWRTAKGRLQRLPCSAWQTHASDAWSAPVQLSWWSMGGMRSYEEVMRLFDRGYQHASQQQLAGKLRMFSEAAGGRAA